MEKKQHATCSSDPEPCYQESAEKKKAPLEKARSPDASASYEPWLLCCDLKQQDADVRLAPKRSKLSAVAPLQRCRNGEIAVFLASDSEGLFTGSRLGLGLGGLGGF